MELINRKLFKEDKLIYLVHFIVQLLLSLWVVYAMGNNLITNVKAAFCVISLAINFSSILIYFIKKDSVYTKDICLATAFLACFIIFDIIVKDYLYVRVILSVLSFLVMDLVYFGLLVQIKIKISNYLILLITLFTGLIIIFFELYFYTFIKILMSIMGIYPIIYLIKNYKIIRLYKKYIFKVILRIAIFQFIFVFSDMFIDMPFRHDNFDLYIFWIVIYTICIKVYIKYDSEISELIKGNSLINTLEILKLLILILIIYVYTHNLYISILISSVIYILIWELSFNKIIFENKNNSLKDIIKEVALSKGINLEMEDLYNQKVINFLHDDILQDVIIVNRDLQDKFHLDSSDRTLKLVKNIINSIRQEINLYSPKINENIPIGKNYLELVN